MVDPPQLPLELLAVGPHGEVDVHHVVDHRLAEVLRDELVLGEQEGGVAWNCEAKGFELTN